MKPLLALTLLLGVLAIQGCTTRGCKGDACSRADSSDRTLVIWWPPSMSEGLEDAKDPSATIINLEE